MGSIEKLENPTIEFFEVTFLGLKPSNCGMTEEEFGQKLFDLVDWGRRHGINADDALCLANRRFKEEHS